MKSEFEQTIKMCDAYESKINAMTRKEDGLREAFEAAKEKLDSVLLEKDKALLKV